MCRAAISCSGCSSSSTPPQPIFRHTSAPPQKHLFPTCSWVDGVFGRVPPMPLMLSCILTCMLLTEPGVWCRELSQCEIYSAVQVTGSGIELRNSTSQAIDFASINLCCSTTGGSPPCARSQGGLYYPGKTDKVIQTGSQSPYQLFCEPSSTDQSITQAVARIPYLQPCASWSCSVILVCRT